MSKRAFLPLLLILSLLTAGCQVLPYLPFVSEEENSPTEALPTATLTLAPTETPSGPTPTSLPPTETPTPTPTPTPEPVYVLQQGSPLYTANFSHPSEGCGWSGVGGQVFDADGVPLTGLFVIAGDDSGQRWAAQTGLSPAYGPGGYEIQLMAQAANTVQVFWVQVVDEDGNALSEQITFDTFEDCERNLALINFAPIGSDAAAHTIMNLTPTATLEAYP